jgi:hypothetical protein
MEEEEGLDLSSQKHTVSSSLSWRGVFTASETRFALIFPHRE